jgi:hypothetical protein
MPRGFLTEDGPRPEFAGLYGAKEHASPKYPPRTERNVIDSDLTILFGDASSRGARLVLRIERDIEDGFRPEPICVPDYDHCPIKVAKIIELIEPRTINIAGQRESSAPGIGEWVERYLSEVFRIINEKR